MEKPTTIEAYLSSFPLETQAVGREMMRIIKEAAPQVTEVISYGMPAFKINRVVVYFALYKNHIGFYPTGEGIEAFKDQLQPYTFSKGAVQFSLTAPLPKKLIQDMVLFKVQRDALLVPTKKITKKN